ncbi:hypothetical protein WAB17_12915 [Parerythrobacter aurantius]|uniref:hypothetical protein n=1 Tax=Parerythrobacter aurantius TaxID=3127706 RepID=UPI00324F04D4
MVRNRKHQKTDPAKLYRHFAVFTVAATALVGIMADGEATQALEDKVRAQQERTQLQEESKKYSTNREIIRRDGASGGGSFGSSNSIAIAGVGTGIGSVDPNNFITVASVEKNGKTVWGRLGLSEEDWFKLPSEVRKSLAGTNDPMVIGTPEERRAAMKKLAAASRSRARPDLSVAGNAIVLEESMDE